VFAVAFLDNGRSLSYAIVQVCPYSPGGPQVNLRWVLAHLLEETARHAGHADILGELIDGRSGR